jgi:hypothetical protein
MYFHEVDKDMKKHIRCNILMSRNLEYPETLWSWTSQILFWYAIVFKKGKPHLDLVPKIDVEVFSV